MKRHLLAIGSTLQTDIMIKVFQIIVYFGIFQFLVSNNLEEMRRGQFSVCRGYSLILLWIFSGTEQDGGCFCL